MSAPENPQAFPLAVPDRFQWAEAGMELRDWFAGQALAGLLAYPTDRDPRKAPEEAYAIADAMLLTRKGGEA